MSDDLLSQSLEALEAFLRSEEFAVDTYEAALDRVRSDEVRAVLLRLRNSHLGRALILRERFSEFAGSAPDRNPEPWGAFATAFHRVVNAADDAAILVALREGEIWSVRDYEIDLDEVESHLRHEISRVVLTEQRRTRDVLRGLLDGLRARLP